MDVPRELFVGNMRSVSPRALAVSLWNRVLELAYARKAIEAVMAICIAFVPPDQLYGLFGSLLQSKELAPRSLDVSSESDPLVPSSWALSARSCGFAPASTLGRVIGAAMLGALLISVGSGWFSPGSRAWW